MPVVGPVLAFAIALLATTYGSLKLVRWSLNGQEGGIEGAAAVRSEHVGHLATLFQWFLMASLAVLFGPSIAGWGYDVWGSIVRLI